MSDNYTYLIVSFIVSFFFISYSIDKKRVDSYILLEISLHPLQQPPLRHTYASPTRVHFHAHAIRRTQAHVQQRADAHTFFVRQTVALAQTATKKILIVSAQCERSDTEVFYILQFDDKVIGYFRRLRAYLGVGVYEKRRDLRGMTTLRHRQKLFNHPTASASGGDSRKRPQHSTTNSSSKEKDNGMKAKAHFKHALQHNFKRTCFT